MTFALARSLLLADAVKQEALADALLVTATRGVSLVIGLLAARAVDGARLERLLEGTAPASSAPIVPVLSLVQKLPPHLCERLLAVPVGWDAVTGTVDVAVVDAYDPHVIDEVAYWLKAPVRVVRTSLVAIEGALRLLRADTAIPPRPDEADAAEEDVQTLVGPTPNIPFVLTRRSDRPRSLDGSLNGSLNGSSQAPSNDAATAEGERESPSEPVTDPVIDLMRRKSWPPDDDLAPPGDDDAEPSTPMPVLVAIRNATHRDDILELVVTGMSAFARRAAVLAVRRDGIVGWTCSPEMADRSVMRGVRLPGSPSRVFASALGCGDVVFAHIPEDAAHAPLLAAMRSPPRGDVALASVRVEDRPVALVIADELSDPLMATARMREIAHAAGDALSKLLRERAQVAR
jgi:hypothetical protein